MKLQDLIKEENILILDFSPSTVEEALVLCCERLVQLGKVTEEYSRAIIKSHHEIGSSDVLAPGIAMPHARPENGVREGSLPLTIFKEGMDFDSDNGNVFLCITLAAKDSHAHIQTLTALSTLFQTNEDVQALIAATSPQEIIEILSKY